MVTRRCFEFPSFRATCTHCHAVATIVTATAQRLAQPPLECIPSRTMNGHRAVLCSASRNCVHGTLYYGRHGIAECNAIASTAIQRLRVSDTHGTALTVAAHNACCPPESDRNGYHLARHESKSRTKALDNAHNRLGKSRSLPHARHVAGFAKQLQPCCVERPRISWRRETNLSHLRRGVTRRDVGLFMPPTVHNSSWCV